MVWQLSAVLPMGSATSTVTIVAMVYASPCHDTWSNDPETVVFSALRDVAICSH
ncbi:hypothetical protein GCM10023322_76210 [Rugosimonospora acidiphila]|uniref:Uncharacterized protein n=1 Tax=Rugosimonospora acidiphila TaxID=556531 RepID=A0ABP9SRD8_9ACTN